MSSFDLSLSERVVFMTNSSYAYATFNFVGPHGRRLRLSQGRASFALAVSLARRFPKSRAGRRRSAVASEKASEEKEVRQAVVLSVGLFFSRGGGDLRFFQAAASELAFSSEASSN